MPQEDLQRVNAWEGDFPLSDLTDDEAREHLAKRQAQDKVDAANMQAWLKPRFRYPTWGTFNPDNVYFDEMQGLRRLNFNDLRANRSHKQ